MAVTASQQRANICRLLDEALETDQPIEVVRKGRKLRIVPEEGQSRLERLAPCPGSSRGDPEDIGHLDWSGEWRPTP